MHGHESARLLVDLQRFVLESRQILSEPGEPNAALVRDFREKLALFLRRAQELEWRSLVRSLRATVELGQASLVTDGPTVQRQLHALAELLSQAEREHMKAGEEAAPASIAPPPLLSERPATAIGATFSAVAPAPGMLAMTPGDAPKAVPPASQAGEKAPPPRPRALFQTLFHLRAFGRAEPEAKKEPAEDPRTPGVLGLRAFPKHRRSTPVPPLPKELGGRRAEVPSVPPLNTSHPPTYTSTLAPLSTGAPASSIFGSQHNATLSATWVGTRSGSHSAWRWWHGALIAFGVTLCTGLGALAWATLRAGSVAAPRNQPVNAINVETQASVPDESVSPVDNAEQFRELLSEFHGHSAKQESAELAEVLDEQAKGHEQLLASPPCDEREAPATCEQLKEIRDFISQLLTSKLTCPQGRCLPRLTERGSGTPPAWLSGLRVPDIPIEDAPEVRRLVKTYTETQAGREALRNILFRCGAYRDLVKSALAEHKLPQSLFAVVLVESQCNPKAKSPVGAHGLWQFMPLAARAYRLAVVDRVVDERMSPVKSTGAAVRYLVDLYDKLGSWDLAFAGYNMGPFGLMTRMRRANSADFWELARVPKLLPAETANYVPQIQAFAVILENLAEFKLLDVQVRASEVTETFEAPAGVRLSLLAQAAATSENQLRGLNPDLLGATLPETLGATFRVQLPKHSLERARETLSELLRANSSDDRCVPAHFDWGRERFTAQMQRACSRVAARPDPGATR